jgi:manganese efflux pump family protein
MWQALVLSFGLAMDSAAVCVARGRVTHRRELVILPVVFGGFQAAMATIGWLLGAWAGTFIARWDRWVAFGLLALIGAKMVLEALGDDPADAPAPAAGSLAVYLGMAVVTSVDAAAAGLTLPMLPVDPWLALTLIGGVTAACSAVAFAAARSLGPRAGNTLEIIGGAVLIGIGVEILVSGLGS